MKQGWTYKKLGEVCNLYQPKTISTKEMVSNGLYDVFGANGKIGKYNSYNHEYSEILMTCRGATCGNINISTPKSWINGNAMVVHIKDEEKLDKKFLIYLLSYIDKTHIITGAAQPQITRQTLFPLQICYPSLTEQQRIVERLDADFAHIDQLKANAEKQLVEARALFQKALAKAMEPKEGVMLSRIADVAIRITKGASPKWQGINYVDDDGVLFITSENIRDGFIKLNPPKYVDEKFNQKQQRSILKKNDVLVNIVGASIGRAAIYDLNVDNANINQAVALVRINPNVLLPKYLSMFLNSSKAYEKYNTMKKDAARANLSLENIGDVELYIPSLDIQQLIISRLDSLSENIKKLEENQKKIIAECDALKQALLRKVFE